MKSKAFIFDNFVKYCTRWKKKSTKQREMTVVSVILQANASKANNGKTHLKRHSELAAQRCCPKDFGCILQTGSHTKCHRESWDVVN